MFFFILFVNIACTPREMSAYSTDDQIQTATQNAELDDSIAPVETTGPDCLGSETHPIGQEITKQFKEASYDEAMTWFCNGAEFEAILVSLQTEKDTGEPAEELFKLFTEGQTWEDIWDAIGFTD